MSEKKAPKGFVEVIKRAHSSTVVVGTCTVQPQPNGTAMYNGIIARGSVFL